MYGIISDTHCHNWSTFYSVGPDGVNSRLRIILDEIERAATVVKEMGGDKLFHAGDLFHVRGAIAPSVLNPVLETFERIVRMGVTPILICGNHDAEFRDADEVGSAVNALEALGCHVYNHPGILSFDDDDGEFFLIPYVANSEAIYEIVTKTASLNFTVICHAAFSGVFAHVDKNVLDPKVFDANSKIKHVFAGHLHNHKRLSDKCWSVGALCQHNWGDIYSKAGFITVDGDDVQFHESQAPRFVEIGSDTNPKDAPSIVSGNYVRASCSMDEKEAREFRDYLTSLGARAVTLLNQPKTIVSENRIDVKATDSIEAIVDRYIKEKVETNQESVLKLAMHVLEQTNEV